jgi:hypothetical protein
MNVLVVGAGAIGQVFGFHLAAGGARVSFLVREHHPLPPSGEFTLNRLRRWGRAREISLRPERIYTSLGEVSQTQWDQVWLCVPSTALEPAWVASLAVATSDATLVFLPAGIDVVAASHPPEDRTVLGLISLMSRSDGTNVTYWLPPLLALMVGGPPQRRDAAAKALRRGGCPAVAGDARRSGAFGSAVLIPHVVALDGAGWSYAAFASGRWLADSVEATKEAASAAAAHLGVHRPIGLGLYSRWAVRLALGLARWLVPFPLADFFRAHFTKLRSQSKAQLEEYIALGERSGTPTPALRRLVGHVLREARSAGRR